MLDTLHDQIACHFLGRVLVDLSFNLLKTGSVGFGPFRSSELLQVVHGLSLSHAKGLAVNFLVNDSSKLRLQFHVVSVVTFGFVEFLLLEVSTTFLGPTFFHRSDSREEEFGVDFACLSKDLDGKKSHLHLNGAQFCS